MFKLCQQILVDEWNVTIQWLGELAFAVGNLHEDKNLTNLYLITDDKNDKVFKTIDKINENSVTTLLEKDFYFMPTSLTPFPNGFMADKFGTVKISQRNYCKICLEKELVP